MKCNTILFTLVLFVMNTSCRKVEQTSLQNQSFVRNFNYSSCKNNTNTESGEYIILSGQNRSYIHVNHINATFNCAPGQIVAEAYIDENNIYINEYSTDHSANCICRYDLDFLIGPIPHNTYTLIMQRNGHERIKTKIIFRKGFFQKIYLNQVDSTDNNNSSWIDNNSL